MFFVQGLTSNRKGVFINPEQVLYICEVGHHKSALALANHLWRLKVDQDPQRVQELFDQYYRDFLEGPEDLAKLN